ncbi:TAP-like protein [Saccharopolyspora kobensis]|uniref:TAP-like protein n=1 Tax=Saccharopolyspora kobensis TaxID=146035 RepID=A0A1H6EGQ5_9PSEU|nr:alpha/beta hydrolase [Saccharopolyspora kobensis]SEG96119.1 TAP-like protein [Saccharopolyspora kobensis]SFD22068.1 TAP-like protein [Saccharopolyspora kobensis]
MRSATRALGVTAVLGALLATGQPAMAKPGAPTFDVPAKFAEQDIQWAPCFEGELPPELPPGSERLQCGTLTTPMNWHDPDNGKEISIAVSRLSPEGGPAGRALFTNPGGPGGAGLSMPLAMLNYGSDALPNNFDVYGIDVRGTGASSTVSCGPAEDAWQGLDSRDRDPASIRAIMDVTREFAAACQQRSGELGRYVTTEQTVADLDLLRLVEGHDKINWYGVSGGTWLGAYLATYFPDSVDKVVLDSNTEFTGSWQQVFSWQPMAFERRWREDLRPWLAAHDETYRLGTTPEQVQATVDGLRAELKANPLPVPDGLPIDHNVLDSLLLQSMYSKYAFPAVGQTLADLRAGTGSEQAVAALAAVRDRNMPMLADPQDSMVATLYSIRCNDTAFRGSPGSVVARSGVEGKRYPFYGYYTISQPCVFWDRPEVDLQKPTGKGLPPVLMLQSENDPATALEGAEIAHRKFQGSRMITVRDEGDHGVYGAGNACVDNAVDAYLIDGTVPADMTCDGMPLPDPAVSTFATTNNSTLLDRLDAIDRALG